MGKRYKLIKWYPSLPKDWEVGMEVGQGARGIFAAYSPCNLKYKGYGILFQEVEGYSEFWEEVKQETFEILEISAFNGNRIDALLPNGKYSIIFNEGENYKGKGEYDFYSYALDKQDCFHIHKVKRLSDGIIFSIGDKVHNPKLQKPMPFVITKFYFDCNNEQLLCNGEHCGNGHINITKIEHYKEPLFVTEDGVAIFENDKYAVVAINDFTYLNNLIVAKSFNDAARGGGVRYNKKYFSTMEIANKYIEENKPQYSKKDMINFANYAKSYISGNLKVKECLDKWIKL